jgi:hypothetical protein
MAHEVGNARLLKIYRPKPRQLRQKTFLRLLRYKAYIYHTSGLQSTFQGLIESAEVQTTAQE